VPYIRSYLRVGAALIERIGHIPPTGRESRFRPLIATVFARIDRMSSAGREMAFPFCRASFPS
jgi:hypothetical protein